MPPSSPSPAKPLANTASPFRRRLTEASRRTLTSGSGSPSLCCTSSAATTVSPLDRADCAYARADGRGREAHGRDPRSDQRDLRPRSQATRRRPAHTGRHVRRHGFPPEPRRFSAFPKIVQTIAERSAAFYGPAYLFNGDLRRLGVAPLGRGQGSGSSGAARLPSAAVHGGTPLPVREVGPAGLSERSTIARTRNPGTCAPRIGQGS
jgi:hypothetical protein